MYAAKPTQIKKHHMHIWCEDILQENKNASEELSCFQSTEVSLEI